MKQTEERKMVVFVCEDSPEGISQEYMMPGTAA